MRIGVVGTGYVGLVSGTCFAEFGIHVVCVDKDESKIAALKNGVMPIYEPGLDVLVEKQVNAGRLSFTTNLKDAMDGADAVFIAVGTPQGDDGHADMRFVRAAAKEIAENMTGYTLIVTKSTVPVGTARTVEKIVKEIKPDAEFDVCSNPEFLREGAAINDFMRPDRVVIGTQSERAVEIMRGLYRPLFLNETPMVITTPETAETIKYAGNAFLATKITFINEIADLCEKTGANVQEVAKGIGLDGRIGSKFLHAGPGYGGSCFPKDTHALAQIGEQYGAPQNIVETVIEVNATRQKSMAERIIKACGGSVKDLKIGILGLSFKPNTDDVRESPALVIIPLLQDQGATLCAFDPAAMDEAKHHLNDIVWCDNAYDVAKDCDALVIITEWNEFRGLNLQRIGESMKTKRLIDLRNIYSLNDMEDKGFHYVSVGRKEIEASDTSKERALKSA